jgi:uncharacterized delta-60 repeat protein
MNVIVIGQITPQYEISINGNGDFGDQFLSVVSDQSNNIYAVGSTVRNNTDRDFLVVKFNAQSEPVWKRVFSAPGNGPDEAKKVLIHPNGNIVVSGYGNNKSVGNDFWTMMFTPNGDTLWSALYNSPSSNLYDEPSAMCFDSQGNIIITGESDQDPTSFLNNDFLTIKYSQNGTLIWAMKYNSPANDNDRSMSVATDNSDNVYVTGRSFNGGDDDIVTIKYNSAGAQQWLKTFDNGGIDRPVSIGVDNQSKIYVAARSDNGTDDDYRIIAYNVQGVQQFNITYDFAGHDRPAAMVVIPAGGCVVTGRCDANAAAGINYDIRTIAYSSTGTQQWLASYAGPAGNDDIATNINISSDGKIVVCGYSDADNSVNINNNIITLSYTSTGTSIINQNFNGIGNGDDEGQAVAYCPNGNIASVGYISDSNSQRNAQILIFGSTNTAPIFQNTIDGTGDNSQNIRDLIFDSSGNTFVCGYTVTKDNNRDFYVSKINGTGNVLWSADTTGTLFGSDEESNSIAFDNLGNICVSGFLKNSGTSSDIYLEKYSTNGNLIWNFGFDGPIHESDRSYDMAIDNSGNIYLCGKSDVDPTWQVNDDILILKISNTGTLLWSKLFSSNTPLDRGQFIGLTSSNEIVVAGKISNGTNDNIILMKYSASGTLVWSYTLDCFGANDKIDDFEILPNGNIAICGQAQLAGNGTDFDGFISIINTAGQQQWIEYFGNTGQTLDEMTALTSGSNNSIWVTGNYDSDNGANENMGCYLARYDQNGVLDPSGVQYFNASNNHYADDIIVNSQDEPLVACHGNTGANGDIDYQMDFLTLVGTNLVSGYQRNVSDSIDVANVIKFNVSNNTLYIGGSTWSNSGQRDALVGKYTWTTILDVAETANEFKLYPTPAQNNINIQGVTEWNTERIEIYGVDGKLIQVYKFNTLSNSSNLDISHLQDGLYTMVLIGSNQKSIHKFIKSAL